MAMSRTIRSHVAAPEHDSATSGQWLIATVDNLKQSMKWSSERIDPEVTASLDRMEKFATSARNNPKVDAAEMSKQLDSTGVEIMKVLAKTTPSRESQQPWLLTPHPSPKSTATTETH